MGGGKMCKACMCVCAPPGNEHGGGGLVPLQPFWAGVPWAKGDIVRGVTKHKLGSIANDQGW